MSNPLDTQVGGSHYKGFPIQPAEFIHANGIGFLAGNVIKYVCRHSSKNGKEDLLKAKHYIEMLIALEYPDNEPRSPESVPASSGTYSEERREPVSRPDADGGFIRHVPDTPGRTIRS